MTKHIILDNEIDTGFRTAAAWCGAPHEGDLVTAGEAVETPLGELCVECVSKRFPNNCLEQLQQAAAEHQKRSV